MGKPDPRALAKTPEQATADELLDQIRLALPFAQAGKGAMGEHGRRSPRLVIVQAVAELDKRLSAGGLLPKAWGEEWGR